jgi:oligopeptide transport system ATP-binding protein
VGESGSGKTALLLAILGLLPSHARVRGSIRYRGSELLELDAARLNDIRGAHIAMVFQDPMSALNPYMRVIDQLSEVPRVHGGMSRRAAEQRALEMLEAVHLGEAERRARQYPHELSGGMRQRVMIAMALIAQPDIVLADEPTTALDVTVQAQILSLLQEMRERTGAALVLVTHDLGVVAQLADRVGVMHGGRIVEQAECEQLFSHPHHPYTQALLRAIPRLGLPP